MTTINKRFQILESIESLNATEADKVLNYIKALRANPNGDDYQKLKRNALLEIRQALNKNVSVNSSAF